MVYKVPEVHNVQRRKSLVSESVAQFLDGKRIIMDRKYHLKGAPGDRSRREERIRGRESTDHADLRHLRNTVVPKSPESKSPWFPGPERTFSRREKHLWAPVRAPGGLQKLDLDERNASVARNAAVTQI